jgi:hypothetical protein
MKTTLITGAVIALCICGSAAYGFQLTPNEFVPAAGFWDVGSDWFLGHSPTSTEVAIIGGGQECFVRVTPQSPVGAIQIAAHVVDGENVDETKITLDDANLTILGDSTIDGTLIVRMDAKLLIGADLTISGSGDIDIAQADEPGVWQITYPDEVNDAYVLTLEDDCSAQQSPCNQVDLEDDCAIVLHGNGAVFVELENNAIVSGDGCAVLESGDFDGLRLVGREKYGCGIWRAEGGGALEVRTEVRGGGKWIVDGPWNGNCDTTIRVQECLLNLTGPVNVIEGQLLVEETFCTTGNLTWVPGDGESSAIEVSGGATATFHNPACPTMFCP